MSRSNLSLKVPPDTVLLHSYGPGKTLPSISPFVLKLETYLRMANIPYQVDTKKPLGPSGKTPWITINGKTLTDSQLIIEHLSREFNKNLWPEDVTEEQKSMARLIRVALEEHCYWGLVHYRWIDSVQKISDIQQFPAFRLKVIKLFAPGRVKKTLHEQGLGRHTSENRVAIAGHDLRNVSAVLGKKKFILGAEPCEEDAAIFGIVAQAVWAAPQSPYEKLVTDELPNLKQYCIRMKEKYWEDWDDVLRNGTSTM